jgi:hypothetical protein
MADVQKKHYTEMLKLLVTEAEGMSPVMAQQTVTRNMKLRQISSGFIIDEAGKPHNLVPLSKNVKINFVKEFMEERIEGKLCVAALFSHSIDMLVEALAEYEPVVIRGKRHMDTHVTEVKRLFNETEQHRIIILQADAAKYNHTLLGTKKSPCHDMLFFENSYSLDTRSQVEDRIHRWGQKYSTTYADVAVSPIDMAAIAALIRKEDVASAIMGFMREKGILRYDARDQGLAEGV